MNNRITTEWTTDTIQAFGDTPAIRKGILAEEMYFEWATKIYDKVTDHSHDRANQVKGFDFSIWKSTWKNEYGVDVKGNLYANGKFFIENQDKGWLRNSKKKSDRIVHVCVESGWAIEYDRRAMIKHLDSFNINDDNVLMSVFDVRIKPIVRKFKVN